MKKILFLLFSIFLFVPVMTLAANPEKIIYFESNIDIHEEGFITVAETIRYDFGGVKRYGFYRDIPIKYNTPAGNYSLDITSIKVDDTWTPAPFTFSQNDSNIRIQIGQTDKVTTGIHTYHISYNVRGAIDYFDDQDELYWNITTNNWLIPIEKTKATVHLPFLLAASTTLSTCFAGPTGATTACAATGFNLKKEATSWIFEEGRLPPGNALTVVVGFPKHLVLEIPQANANQTYAAARAVTMWDKATNFAHTLWMLFIPVIIFLICFIRWFWHGRDPRGRGIIYPLSSPPLQISPAEAGTLLDENADSKDISAEIIFLATRGYLTITREPKNDFSEHDDYIFKRRQNDNGLTVWQHLLYNELFKHGRSEVRLSDIKGQFYTILLDIKEEICSALVHRGYFAEDPERLRYHYYFIGILASGSLAIFGFVFSWLFVGSVLCSGIIVIMFGRIMPQRTLGGVRAREELLGLKMYLGEDGVNPKGFEALLPYALVLGEETAWAAKFKDLNMTKPDWYNDTSITTFDTTQFANNIGSFHKLTANALTKQS